MLAKSKRLTTAEFDEVMAKGKVVHSPLFIFRILRGDKETKVSTVAPQKIAKTAVLRSQNRRKIYAAIEPLWAQINEGTKMIIFAKKDIRTEDIHKLSTEIEKVLLA